jgi:uncharacterized membrane protein
MKFAIRWLNSTLIIAAAVTVFALSAQTSPASKDECEKKRELCISSCAKQRQDCDKNHPDDSDYCVKQDKQCQKGCEDAWRKCGEKQDFAEILGGR